MDEVERQRRQKLIEATAQRDPELARMIASGPYQRIDEGVGATATPQEAWQRGASQQYPPQAPPNTPIMSTINQWQNQAPPPQQQQPGARGIGYAGQQVQASQSGPVANSPAYGMPGGISYAQSQQGGPIAPGQYSQGYQAPQPSDRSTSDRLRGPYENPFIQSQGSPPIVINVGGGQMPQLPQWMTPPAQNSWQQYDNRNAAATYPGQAMSSYSNQDYPYASNYLRPEMMSGGPPQGWR